jgi:hypothetical protein
MSGLRLVELSVCPVSTKDLLPKEGIYREPVATDGELSMSILIHDRWSLNKS